MKKILFILLSSTLLFSCIKPDPPQTFTPEFWSWTGTDPMSAEIDGAPWQCPQYSAYYTDTSIKHIVGIDDSANYISISASGLAPGEYDIAKGNSQGNNAAFNVISGISYKSIDATEGKVKILENDGSHVKGLFYFNGYSLVTGSAIKVTKGYFNFKNWDWTGTAPMSAIIDGIPWLADQSATYSEPSGAPKQIEGYDNNGSNMIIAANNFPIGEFELFGSPYPSAFFSDFGLTKNYSSTFLKLGKVKILENDAIHIKGLFYFDARDLGSATQIKVRKGYFNIIK